ncbi:hypothetical protein KR200_003847 [Drosophila serrata]|nr:hypothetical protein KR200_003847 [Drosophila serrata]
MSIYDYLRQHLSSAKRRRSSQDLYSYSSLPAAKLRKHNYSNYRWERERERQEERERRNGRTNNASMDNYDIRFFFYLNSLILFTMSCSRQYDGDDLKHFICERIRKFDRLRRKARKRRKRRSKQLQL